MSPRHPAASQADESFGELGLTRAICIFNASQGSCLLSNCVGMFVEALGMLEPHRHASAS